MEVRLLPGSRPGQQAGGPRLQHPGPPQGPLQQTSHRDLRGEPGHSVREETGQDEEVLPLLTPPLSLRVQRGSPVTGEGPGGLLTSNVANILRKSNSIISKHYADNIFIKPSADFTEPIRNKITSTEQQVFHHLYT